MTEHPGSKTIVPQAVNNVQQNIHINQNLLKLYEVLGYLELAVKSRVCLLNYIHVTGQINIYDIKIALDVQTNGFRPYPTETLAPQKSVMFCGCECFRFPQ